MDGTDLWAITVDGISRQSDESANAVLNRDRQRLLLRVSRHDHYASFDCHFNWPRCEKARFELGFTAIRFGISCHRVCTFREASSFGKIHDDSRD